jgi:hypothetical protein
MLAIEWLTGEWDFDPKKRKLEIVPESEIAVNQK